MTKSIQLTCKKTTTKQVLREFWITTKGQEGQTNFNDKIRGLVKKMGIGMTCSGCPSDLIYKLPVTSCNLPYV